MKDSGVRSHSRWVLILIIGHIAALSFGLAGLLIAVPNPHLWADSELGVRVYHFGMQYAGGLHILFATAAMLLVGVWFLGLRRTSIFLVLTVIVSLGAELLGTTTGFPFGDYRYTSGLGYKILDEVPFTIPLSWFYMGLASYVLALVLVGTSSGWRRPLAAVLGGSLLLTVWDLVLDPAMAHQALDVRFWVWDQTGLYFGMPAQNFLGWVAVGFVFIGLSRIAWGSDPPLESRLVRVSYVIYLANLIFAMVISGAVGLWWPVLITVLIGIVPATVALLIAEASAGDSGQSSGIREDDPVHRVAQRVMSIGAQMFLARDTREHSATGAENVPSTGPVVLAARHYHHLLDGCMLYIRLPRDVHILVTNDWATPGWRRSLLDLGCRVARWPVIVRPDSQRTQSMPDSARRSLIMRGFRDAVHLLEEGRALVIFPEGYPDIDPHGSPKSKDGEMLEFKSGFLRVVRAAERRIGESIPIVPVGFAYQRTDDHRWSIDLNVGEPRFRRDYPNENDLINDLRSHIEALSVPAHERATNQSTQLSETT
jgi:uncharacterized membrane protein/1-acyl-sn-glycerol-3-phosphate acyltransferase